jgi:hypothetical protein
VWRLEALARCAFSNGLEDVLQLTRVLSSRVLTIRASELATMHVTGPYPPEPAATASIRDVQAEEKVLDWFPRSSGWTSRSCIVVGALDEAG